MEVKSYMQHFCVETEKGNSSSCLILAKPVSLSLHSSVWRNVKNNKTIHSKRFFSLDLLLLAKDLMAFSEKHECGFT